MFATLRSKIKTRLLLIRLFFSPKAKKRYLEHQRQMELNRIRLKATRNWNTDQQNAMDSGAFVSVGDRLVVLHRSGRATLDDMELSATLSHIEVNDNLELNPEEAAWMFHTHSKARANRKTELFPVADNISEDADPWMKYHKIS